MFKHAYTTLNALGTDHKALQALREQLNDYDFVSMRFGREVIITSLSDEATLATYTDMLKLAATQKDKIANAGSKTNNFFITLNDWSKKCLGVTQIKTAIDMHLKKNFNINSTRYAIYQPLLTQQDVQTIYRHLREKNQL